MAARAILDWRHDRRLMAAVKLVMVAPLELHGRFATLPVIGQLRSAITEARRSAGRTPIKRTARDGMLFAIIAPI